MRIAIIGYGKMGRTIEELALNKGHEIAIKIDSSNHHNLNAEILNDIDVAIEFSNPDAAIKNISICLESGIPMVSGTTGWLENFSQIQQLCDQKKGAFFYASNFSVGVNVFFALNQKLAELMNRFPSYKVSMEEIHHTQKLDAPSGTAISLAQDIINLSANLNAYTIDPDNKKTDHLFIDSVREGQVPGTHLVNYHSSIDSIEIKHTAHSRIGFASGALLAAEWILGKKGMFSMKDLLEL